MSSLNQRIAAAPISWGVSEVPGWGHQISPSRVLKEILHLGIRASEMGPHSYFANDEVADEITASGFSIVAGFVPLRFRFPHGLLDHPRDLHQTFGWLRDVRARFAVLAVTGDEASYESRPRLQGAQWNRVADALVRVQDMAAAYQLRAVLHPHFGTFVESTEDTRAILERAQIGLCLDTGHLALAGDDPLVLASTVPERVQLVHLKDVDAALADRVRQRQLSYHDAIKKGLFRPLGRGIARISEFITQLESSGYQGWYVLEQDVALSKEPPSGGGPVLDAAESVSYLSDLEDELRGGKVSKE